MKLLKLTAATYCIVAAVAGAEVHQHPWGRLSTGDPVELYTLSSDRIQVEITDYGAHIVSIETPDRTGHKADVVLGFNTVEGYENPANGTYMGGTIGRYANRIRAGGFSLDGHAYTIPANDHGNALHGGTVGFDRRIWRAREIPDGVELTLTSPDGDMGFPGTVEARVRYALVGSSLRIDYMATSDMPTVINLTNHSYSISRAKAAEPSLRSSSPSLPRASPLWMRG